MKILALIPARGGSKRLPGKNLKQLGGKPLINWTIEAVRDIPEVFEILVSTDSPEIASVAKSAGAQVPWLRPTELSTNDASSVDVAIHALNWYQDEVESIDGLLLLQPTSPFRSKEMISAGIEIFQNSSKETVVGVNKLSKPIELSMKIVEGHLKPVYGWESLGQRSHEATDTYIVNGSFYLIEPELLLSTRSFYQPLTLPLVISDDKGQLDIDTESDFRLAEFYFHQDMKDTN